MLRLDAGQANYFEMAEKASSEHPSFVLASDSARRAAEKSTRLADPKNPASADSSIDALNEHLRKIEELRRKLEREDSLILELAPAVETAGRRGRRRARRLRFSNPPRATRFGHRRRRGGRGRPHDRRTVLCVAWQPCTCERPGSRLAIGSVELTAFREAVTFGRLRTKRGRALATCLRILQCSDAGMWVAKNEVTAALD